MIRLRQGFGGLARYLIGPALGWLLVLAVATAPGWFIKWGM